MQERKVYFSNLDGLRFIAALMVYLQHGFTHWSKEDTIQNDFLLRLLQTISSGGMGVSIFFVLSGFLITYLLLAEQKQTGTINLKKFYIRRVLRIWPLYYLVVVFGMLIYPSLKSMMGIESIFESNLSYYWLFLSNFDEIAILHNGYVPIPQVLTITWSVAIEEQFYLIWPLLFLIFPPASYKYVFPLVILSSVFFRVMNADDDPTLYFHTFSVLIDMAAGGMAAYFAISKNGLASVFSGMSVPVSLIIYTAGFAGLMYWDLFEGYYTHALVRIYFVAYFLFIILHQNYAPHSFLKLSNYRWISAQGKYTYGFYLLHPVAILIIDSILKVNNVPRSNTVMEILLGIGGFVLTMVLSYASYHFYEKRFLNLKKQFTIIPSGT